MTHSIENNIYNIKDNNGNVLLSIKLDENLDNQIVLSTNKEVYSGPIDFLSFKNIKNDLKYKFEVGDRIKLHDGTEGVIQNRFDLADVSMVRTGPSYLVEYTDGLHNTPEYLIKEKI